MTKEKNCANCGNMSCNMEYRHNVVVDNNYSCWCPISIFVKLKMFFRLLMFIPLMIFALFISRKTIDKIEKLLGF